MSSEPQVVAAPPAPITLRSAIETVVALFKLRVVALLLMAAVGGAFLGAQGVPSPLAIVILLITGTLAAGGASAINQFLEREADTRMRRTRQRPLASGDIQRPGAILLLALMMILIAVFSVLPSNPPMALYLALGALIYVGVYTIWLKPRSITNIVIGGAAGSCAVMTGGAAVGAASDPAVIVLALLVFLWTPVHFWALAMFYREDYSRVNVPMLPVRVPAGHSARWILIHTLGTGVAALALGFIPSLGWLYLIPVGAITIHMVIQSVKLLGKPDRERAIRLFITSNIFLALVLLATMLASAAHQILFS